MPQPKEILPQVTPISNGLKVFPSQKGENYMATYKGFLYTRHRTGTDNQAYRCANFKKGCKARMFLSLSNKTVTRPCDETQHNHNSDPAMCDAKYIMSKVRRSAATTTTSSVALVAQELQNVPLSSQASLPIIANMKRTIRRTRITSNQQPIRAQTRGDIPDIFDRFKTPSGEDFLKHDIKSGTNANDRILIFSTDANLDWLQATEHWFCDGTFKSSPILFDQLLTIHGLRIENRKMTSFPLVFCLTPNRVQSTYQRIFKALKVSRPGLAPLTIMADFERALQNAFRDEFPAVTQKGCYFNFRQAIAKNIRGNAELREYKDTNSEWSLNLSKLVSLAFVPPSDVVSSFVSLESSTFFEANSAILDSHMGYFMNTWIGGFNRRGLRKPPMFPVELWNCYDSVIEGLPKTNNFCEGFHRGFSALLASHHPNLDKLVNALLKEQNLIACKMEQFIAGIIQPSLPSERLAVLRLKDAVGRYGTMSTILYLRGIAHWVNL